MRTYVDTSAFYAILDRDDANHQKAKHLWSGLLQDQNILVTSNYVLVETFALLQSRLGLAAVRTFQEDILPLINVEFVTPNIHRAGIAAFLLASKRNLSLVDCVSFEIMRTLGIRNAFVFDAHFKQQGFLETP
jgi:predicted nucleic acid-binding protein